MLPCRGYFGAIPCVFFLEDGCQRPFCHFSHSMRDKLDKFENRSFEVKNEMIACSHVNFVGVKNLERKSQETKLSNSELTSEESEILKIAVNSKFSDRLADKTQFLKKRNGFSNDQNAPSYKPSPIYPLKIIKDCVPAKQLFEKQIEQGNELKENREKNHAIKRFMFSEGQRYQNYGAIHSDIAPISAKRTKGIEKQTRTESSKLTSVECLAPEKSSKNMRLCFFRNKWVRMQTDIKENEKNCDADGSKIKNHENPASQEGEVNDRKPHDVYAKNVNAAGQEDCDEQQIPCKKKKVKEPTEFVTSLPTGSDHSAAWAKAIEKVKNLKNNNIEVKIQKALNKSKRLPTTSQCSNPSFLRKIARAAEVAQKEILPLPRKPARLAHKLKRCVFPEVSENMKIPLSFRQYYCNALYDEFIKTLCPEQASIRAKEVEFDLVKNCKITNVYKNNCVLYLMKLRKRGGTFIKEDINITENVTSSSCPEFTFGWSLHKCFSKYLLTTDELRQNGYPLLVPGESNSAYTDMAFRRYSVTQPDNPLIRVCVNCLRDYEINIHGVPLQENNCFYHWGKMRKTYYKGQWIEKFLCCGGLNDSVPCESSKFHVWSGRDENCMPDFIETKKLPDGLEDSKAGIYALDCEMCYTTKGLELARLTVVNLNENVVFDEVIALERPILDYCTRFSGITEEAVLNATYSFEDVQRWVLDHFYDKTILIGHSLDNDLKALKIIHSNVIDTSVVFPHKFGPPHKMSLKHLANSFLKVTIQENVGGHDSKEDAVTCLRLMMMKVKEDSASRKPRVIIRYTGMKK